MQNVVDHFAELDPEDARAFYHLSKDSADWKVSLAQKDIKNHQGEVCPILYRPLDMRYTYYTGKTRGFIGRPRHKLMRHILGGTNVALVFSRQNIPPDPPVISVMVTDTIVDGNAIHTSNGIANVAPLYLLPDKHSFQQKEVNINPDVRAEIASLAYHPHFGVPDEYQIFDYVYGALQCPAYQEAYAAFFKEDFPRIPKPKTPEEFWDIANKGRQLRQLHLFQTLSSPPISFNGDGNHIVDIPKYQNGRIMINKTQGFDEVPQQVWECYVGGFQVAQKWLKDRKGRKLELEDIQQYTRILSILNETDRIRKTITMKLPVRKTDSQ